MPYRVIAPLVIIKDREGRARHHYRDVPASAGIGGPVIPWLSNEQAAHLLRLGLIETIEEQPVDHPGDPLQDCLKALEHLGVDLAAGAPTARTVLREGGYRYGNDIVASAIKARKDAVRALSGTASR